MGLGLVVGYPCRDHLGNIILGVDSMSFPLLFAHDSGDWLSNVIAWFTHGGPTHVAFLSPCGTKVREASGTTREGFEPGVREVDFEVWKAWHPEHEICWLPHDSLNHQEVWDKAGEYIGQGYDWGGIFAWVTRLWSFEDKARLTCSEYVYQVCIDLGHPLFDLDHKSKATPRNLRMISRAYT